MRTTVNLTSGIFDKAVRTQAFRAPVIKTAKSYKDTTRRRMIEGPHTGKVYEKSPSGKRFTRSHRASRRGQRPSPDTLTLVNAVADRSVGTYSSEVFIEHRINPENGEDAHEYAERLQNDMGRLIMTESDAFVHGKYLQFECEKAIEKLK